MLLVKCEGRFVDTSMSRLVPTEAEVMMQRFLLHWSEGFEDARVRAGVCTPGGQARTESVDLLKVNVHYPYRKSAASVASGNAICPNG